MKKPKVKLVSVCRPDYEQFDYVLEYFGKRYTLSHFDRDVYERLLDPKPLLIHGMYFNQALLILECCLRNSLI